MAGCILLSVFWFCVWGGGDGDGDGGGGGGCGLCVCF